jgi:hypothetical protein
MANRVKPVGVFEAALDVVNRARADHYQQTRIFLLQDSGNPLTALHDRAVALLGHGKLCLQRPRCDEPHRLLDAQILSRKHPAHYNQRVLRRKS